MLLGCPFLINMSSLRAEWSTLDSYIFIMKINVCCTSSILVGSLKYLKAVSTKKDVHAKTLVTYQACLQHSFVGIEFHEYRTVESPKSGLTSHSRPSSARIATIN